MGLGAWADKGGVKVGGGGQSRGLPSAQLPKQPSGKQLDFYIQTRLCRHAVVKTRGGGWAGVTRTGGKVRCDFTRGFNRII